MGKKERPTRGGRRHHPAERTPTSVGLNNRPAYLVAILLLAILLHSTLLRPWLAHARHRPHIHNTPPPHHTRRPSFTGAMGLLSILPASLAVVETWIARLFVSGAVSTVCCALHVSSLDQRLMRPPALPRPAHHRPLDRAAGL